MDDLTPTTRKEHWLARIAGEDDLVLEPQTREEHFYQKIIDSGGGGGGEVTPASIVTATGQMSEAQKSKTRTNLGVVSTATMGNVYNRLDALEGTTVTVEGATPTITPAANTVYNCGELTSLTITNPPATGKYSLIFFSGATATVVTGIDNFTPEANKRYRIDVQDGYATFASWPYTPTP